MNQRLFLDQISSMLHAPSTVHTHAGGQGQACSVRVTSKITETMMELGGEGEPRLLLTGWVRAWASHIFIFRFYLMLFYS